MAIKVSKEGMFNVFHVLMYAVMLILLGALIFVLLYPRSREEFQQVSMQKVSSRSLYKTSDNFDVDVSGLATVLDDKDDPLLMAGCYQLNPKYDPRAALPKDVYIYSFGIYTNTFEEVRAKIMSSLSTIKTRLNSPIEGDVYVLIQQSPYMRDNEGNVIAVQYNISSYKFEPKSGKNVADVPLFIRAYIILDSYSRSLSRLPAAVNINQHMIRFRTKKDQCFIKCVNDTTSSVCGCLNRIQNEQNPKSYTSSCSSTPNRTGAANTSVNVPVDFAVMYKVNRLSSAIAQSNVFSSR